ncbi:HPP family protein [Brucellaceae bacterium D45D]
MNPNPPELRQNRTAKPWFGFSKPMLAGATLRERSVACLGALIGIALTSVVSALLLGAGSASPLIVAPMGASAVLLFAVPTSPLAQPWSIIGGNVISAFVGLTVVHFVNDPQLAVGLSVAFAIAAMSMTRSLHPPGGAAALTAALGGTAVSDWGLLFPLVPVGLNSCLLVGLGIAFHRLSRRQYPHRVAAPQSAHATQDLPPSVRMGFREEDIDRALDALDESFDIDRNDLGRLLRQVELQATVRAHGDLTCADVMSRDVVTIGENDTTEQARDLLLRHRILTLPVIDPAGKLVGVVGLRRLMRAGVHLRDHMAKAVTARPGDAALALLPALTDGLTPAAIIVDEDENVVGVMTKSDLLSALAHVLPSTTPKTIRVVA